MFGDCLLKNLNLLKNSDPNARKGDNAFWVILLKSAIQDIISIYPRSIHSDEAIEIYFHLLKEHEDYVPNELRQLLNNGQEKYRVKIRNVFSSNSNHKSGLQNQKEIVWTKLKKLNYTKRETNTIIYEANSKYVMTELLRSNDGIDVYDCMAEDDDDTIVKLANGETYKLLREQLPRERRVRDKAIEIANYKCELCGKEKTFLTNELDQYFEGHHLIMLTPKIQQRYSHSLDDVENVFCLCPTCHRKVHFGTNEEKTKDIYSLLDKHPNLKKIYNIASGEDVQMIINDYLEP